MDISGANQRDVGKPDLQSGGAFGRWVVRVGRRLRRFINPSIKKYSLVSVDPFLDPSEFSWTAELEKNWKVIRAEARQILKYVDAIPSISEISPDHQRLDDDNRWLSYFLWGYGFKSEENCHRCPKTAELVEKVPGMTTALFSIHKPGKCIPPHKGVTSGVLVAHLGLEVPVDRENCAIRVENEVKHWQDGKVFVFDDTYEHETWNQTDETRVILLLHVKRPTRFPGNVLANLFYGGIRRSPFIHDALSAMKLWEDKFSEMERTGVQK